MKAFNSIFFLTLFIWLCNSNAQKLFRNPISDRGTDPSVIKRNGSYYLLHSDGFGTLEILKSSKLSDFRDAQSRVIVIPEIANLSSSSSSSSKLLQLSPKLVQVQGGLYIYYGVLAMGSGISTFVLECLNPDEPLGEWSLPVAILPPGYPSVWDYNVFEDKNGQLYFLWAGNLNNEIYPDNLHISKMDSPLKVNNVSEATLLRTPTMEWEDRTFSSPQIIQTEDRTFLVFIGKFPYFDACLGIMGIEGEKDPMIAENWWDDVKRCVFESSYDEMVFSIRHLSFVKSPDDSELWMVYGAEKDRSAQVVTARIQKIGWEMNAPKFPPVLGLNRVMEVPKGE